MKSECALGLSFYLQRLYLVSIKVNSVSCVKATEVVLTWAKYGESRYVCLANVHMLMEAYDSQEFRQIVNFADLVTSDSRILTWLLKIKYRQSGVEQVCGRDLARSVCQVASFNNISIGLYGSSPDVLKELADKL